jgi:Amt family ammonium transporter
MPQFDTGNTGFMVLCTVLVLIMTPGLAFFYAGLVGRKNVVTIMVQSFISMAWTTVLWYLYGYSLCFSGDWHGIIGNLNLAFLHNTTLNTPTPGSPTIPLYVFIAYQIVCAIITPALITGAFANRVTFKAYMLFLTAWLTFVYCPFVHMVWGGGLLAQWGVRDFAGGIVVHNIAGFSALASVFYIGKRKVFDHPHSVPLVAIGTALLWFGWFGFNAGNELKMDSIAINSFLNTHLAGSFAAMTWLLIGWIRDKKPSFLGFMTGVLAGLVAVTPASGYVSSTTAVIIGIIAGAVCYSAVALKNKMGWDDALDVWGVHGVGGFLGIVLLGVFADSAFNPTGPNGLLLGDHWFFIKECTAVIFSSACAFVFTLVMLKIIDWITPVRVSEETEESGLDIVLHGEQAYDDTL